VKRRELLIAWGAWASLGAARAWAQAAKAPRRIGFLSPGTRELSQPNLDIFRSALKGLGYAEGHDLVIDIRWSEGVTERLPALARELLAAVVPVNSAEDFSRAYARIKEHRADVVWAVPHALLVAHARRLSELALQARLPLVGPRRAFTDGGALLSYDNDVREDYRRAASYVDRILKGAKPADLPVEQPDRFQLVVNLRAAKALGIKVPPSVRARADEVIE
jgi:hypothetical protein